MSSETRQIVAYLVVALVALAIGVVTGIVVLQLLGAVFVALAFLTWWFPYLNRDK